VKDRTSNIVENSRTLPVKPVAPYLGGKSRLAKRIIGKIKTIPHATYAEVFVGMGGVFLRRDHQAKCEVINDRNRDVYNLFRVLQEHYPYFIDLLKWRLTTRVEFERLTSVDPDTLTDLQRAARFLYLQRTAFGGKVSGRNFGVAPGRPGRFDITKLAPMLEDLHSRLAGVTIECLDYAAFIDRYDRSDTLFYLDPPYYGNEGDYGKDIFSRNDFTKLADQLGQIKGSFILSLNDRPEVREIFSSFKIEAVNVAYSISKKTEGRKSYGEVLISNQ
tara:strand:- start:45891 stop:46715 length:825 start_codon:yes stop_codon:yes gene_type:complete